MTVTWYPKNVVIGVVLLAALGVALTVAVDAARGVIIGIGALVVCVIVDLMFSFNPAVWRPHDRSTSRR